MVQDVIHDFFLDFQVFGCRRQDSGTGRSDDIFIFSVLRPSHDGGRVDRLPVAGFFRALVHIFHDFDHHQDFVHIRIFC